MSTTPDDERSTERSINTNDGGNEADTAAATTTHECDDCDGYGVARGGRR